MVVFSDEYHQTIEVTPHLSQKTSAVVIALLLFILGGISFAVITYLIAANP